MDDCFEADSRPNHTQYLLIDHNEIVWTVYLVYVFNDSMVMNYPQKIKFGLDKFHLSSNTRIILNPLCTL